MLCSGRFILVESVYSLTIFVLTVLVYFGFQKAHKSALRQSIVHLRMTKMLNLFRQKFMIECTWICTHVVRHTVFCKILNVHTGLVREPGRKSVLARKRDWNYFVGWIILYLSGSHHFDDRVFNRPLGFHKLFA